MVNLPSLANTITDTIQQVGTSNEEETVKLLENLERPIVINKQTIIQIENKKHIFCHKNQLIEFFQIGNLNLIENAIELQNDYLELQPNEEITSEIIDMNQLNPKPYSSVQLFISCDDLNAITSFLDIGNGFVQTNGINPASIDLSNNYILGSVFPLNFSPNGFVLFRPRFQPMLRYRVRNDGINPIRISKIFLNWTFRV